MRLDIDIDALEHFIGVLQSFNSNLENDWSRVNSSWRETSDSWRDIKRDQFEGAVGWDGVMRMMEGYLSTGEQYTTFLKRLAEAGRGYQDV